MSATLQRARPGQTYQAIIGRQLQRRGALHIDPRHVEAWIRDSHASLDALTASEFVVEIDTAIALIAAGGARQAEMLARAFGL